MGLLFVKELPKVAGSSRGVLKRMVEKPREEKLEGKEKPKEEKVRKCLAISSEANRLLVYLYGDGVGSHQSDVFEKAIRLLWISKQKLPEDDFKRLVSLLEKRDYEAVMNRLKIEFASPNEWRHHQEHRPRDIES